MHFVFMKYLIGIVFFGEKDKINSPDLISNAVGL